MTSPTAPTLVQAAVHLLVTGASVFIVAKILPGVRVKSFGSALAFAFVAALVNAAAFWFLSPLGAPTRGFGGFVLNGIVFLIAARIVGGVKISGCVMAAIASLGVTFVSHFLQHVLRQYLP